jgi:DNA (cytosine-5)-methyltransferase 1
VSLFSNCGAGDLGYREAGFRFSVMAELDPRRLQVALLNHKGASGVPGDLRTTWKQVVKAYKDQHAEPPALLAACPPCQGMSSARGARGLELDADAGSKDERNLLVTVISSVAGKLKPRAIVVENVGAFFTRKVRHPDTRKAISAASLLIETLGSRYVLFPFWTDLADYGVPQTRKRAFLTFIRRDEEQLERLRTERRAPYPRPTHSEDYGGERQVSVDEALRELLAPPLDAGALETARSAEHGDMHCVPFYEPTTYAMVSAIPPGSGRTAWQTNACGRCGEVDVGATDATCPACNGPLLRPTVREKGGKIRLVRGFMNTAYRRMAPNEPAATITTATGHLGSAITIHPWQNRVLSPLECAHLQTFPPGFKWGTAMRDWGHTNVREMIGEAVPPKFTGLHGSSIAGVLTGRLRSALIAQSDPRCVAASRKLGLQTT